MVACCRPPGAPAGSLAAWQPPWSAGRQPGSLAAWQPGSPPIKLDSRSTCLPRGRAWSPGYARRGGGDEEQPVGGACRRLAGGQGRLGVTCSKERGPVPARSQSIQGAGPRVHAASRGARGAATSAACAQGGGTAPSVAARVGGWGGWCPAAPCQSPACVQWGAGAGVTDWLRVGGEGGGHTSKDGRQRCPPRRAPATHPMHPATPLSSSILLPPPRPPCPPAPRQPRTTHQLACVAGGGG